MCRLVCKFRTKSNFSPVLLNAECELLIHNAVRTLRLLIELSLVSFCPATRCEKIFSQSREVVVNSSKDAKHLFSI